LVVIEAARGARAAARHLSYGAYAISLTARKRRARDREDRAPSASRGRKRRCTGAVEFPAQRR